MRRIQTLFLLVLVCLATAHPVNAQEAAPAPALSTTQGTSTGPFFSDSTLDANKIGAWLSVILLLFGLWKDYQSKRTMEKWALIKSMVPEAHNVAQKIAALTPTKKDEKFLEVVTRALEAFGFVLLPAEEKAVKELGEGYHQEFKLERSKVDAGLAQAEVAARTAVESGALPAAPASAEGN